MSSITMKRKPTKPKRKKETVIFSCNYENLQAVVEWATEHKADFKDVEFAPSSDYDSDGNEAWVQVKESDTEFQKRMDNYRSSLAVYNKWYKKNKEILEEEQKIKDTNLRIKKITKLKAARAKQDKILAELEASL